MFLLTLVILIVVLQFSAAPGSCFQLVNIVEDLAAKERVAGRDQKQS